jgi:two-component system cell cycle sensor histidine kinase/response regulator CckA
VLAGGIAHDFNNLLTIILGRADLALAASPRGSGTYEAVTDIVTAARRAADLCRQMLAYSGRGLFVVGDLDLNEIVREMTELIQTSISKKARLTTDLAEGLPPVRGDATQLRQVNLITNASESLGEQSGSIEVRSRAAF